MKIIRNILTYIYIYKKKFNPKHHINPMKRKKKNIKCMILWAWKISFKQIEEIIIRLLIKLIEVLILR